MSSTRCSEFHFVNSTSVVFYRHLHILHHGDWKRRPLEAIHPKQEMVCLSEATRALGTFSGKIQYAVVLAGIEYIVCSEFEIPVLGENKHISVMGCNVDSRAQGLPEAKTLFELTYSADPTVFSKFVVTLSETPEGAAFLQKCRQELHIALEQLQGARPYGVYDPVNLPPELPLHFLWNVRNIDWKRRLRKAHRSLLIRIVNLTSFVFVLDRRGEEKRSLEEGQWVEFPSEEIPPFCCTEFGCQSDGFLLGTGGSCTYLVVNQPGHLLFVWDQPGMGGCRSLGVHSTHALRIFRHAENLNEGTLVFHVLDPANPPLIQIEDARALPPQAWGSAALRSDPQGCLSVAEAMEAARFGADVLPVLLPFLEQLDCKGQGPLSQQQLMRGGVPSGKWRGSVGSAAGSDAGASAQKDKAQQQIQPFTKKQIVITSPRAFFCVLQGFKNYRSLCLPNSWLLLSWRIGCERYFRVWGPDEKIVLSGWHVAGLDGKASSEAVMKAQVLNLRRTPPELKTPSVVASSPASGDMAETFLPAADEEVLEVLVEGFRICCSGLQPQVDKCMRTVLGPDWLEKCKLPKQHIWPGAAIDGEGELIDLEGLLHLVTAFWNEVFEQKVEDPQLLQHLQTVVICWATQELSRFDRSRVYGFLRVAAILLRRFDVDASAKRLEGLARRFATAGKLEESDEALIRRLASRRFATAGKLEESDEALIRRLASRVPTHEGSVKHSPSAGKA